MRYCARFGYFFFILSLLISSGCSNHFSSPTSTYNYYREMVKAGDKEKWLACYSLKTRELLAELEKKSAPFKESQKNQKAGSDFDKLPQDTQATPPKIVREEVNGERGTLVLKSETDQEERNLTFIREDGAWKMDMSKELEAAVQVYDNIEQMKGGIKEFLGKMKNSSDSKQP
jgi:hypothetical protein